MGSLLQSRWLLLRLLRLLLVLLLLLLLELGGPQEFLLLDAGLAADLGQLLQQAQDVLVVVQVVSGVAGFDPHAAGEVVLGQLRKGGGDRSEEAGGLREWVGDRCNRMGSRHGHSAKRRSRLILIHWKRS